MRDTPVAMRNPLKQGLKLQMPVSMLRTTNCRNAKSTKTRIETPLYMLVEMFADDRRNAKSTKTRIETITTGSFPVCKRRVAMRNPLKQGLKPQYTDSADDSLKVAMRNPLKQGLKPHFITSL